MSRPSDWVKPPLMQPAPAGAAPQEPGDPMAQYTQSLAQDRASALQDAAARREMMRQQREFMRDQIEMLSLTRQMESLTMPRNGNGNGNGHGNGDSAMIEMLKVLGQKDEATQRSIADLQRQMMEAQQRQMQALQEQLASLSKPQQQQSIIEKAQEIKTMREAFSSAFPDGQQMPDRIQTSREALEWFRAETDCELKLAEFRRLEAKDERERKQAEQEVEALKSRYQWLGQTLKDVGPMITQLVGARFGGGGAPPNLAQQQPTPETASTQIPTVTIECQSCHRPMEVRADQSRAECPRCGAVMYAPGYEPGDENVLPLPRQPSAPVPRDSEGGIIDSYPLPGPPLTPPPPPARIQPPSPVG